MPDYLVFPAGLRLLSRWQSGDPQARTQLKQIFDDTIAGKYDASFLVPTPNDTVHTTGSVHMLTLSILNDLYGIVAADYYKTDIERYVRSNLITCRLLGLSRLYLTWAIYAFTCEAIGQVMMYPDKFPPGSDPDIVLINKDNWQSVQTPDFDTGIPEIVTSIMRVSQRLTGMQPTLQISAPYSLAADIYGQEPLLADVVHDPEHVNKILDHLVDQVLCPWAEHFFNEFPAGWLELSDASGSPFFIGPENCKNIAIRSMKRMIEGKPWADRMFDANYRGDFVTQAKKKTRAKRRRGASPETTISLEQLTDLKHSVCPNFIMRLESDKVPVSFYTEQAITRGVSLTLGIGSGQVDRNSVGDLEQAKLDVQQIANEFVDAIKQVCAQNGRPDNSQLKPVWPSHIYFEDISAQSQFDLIEIIIGTAYADGALSS